MHFMRSLAARSISSAPGAEIGASKARKAATRIYLAVPDL
jgi:hypothetical protein